MKRFSWLIFIAMTAHAKTVHYDLTLEQKSVNITGKKTVDFALTVNGGIPAPTLQFTEGDQAEIVVHNKTAEETSIHWHGMLLPNAMDGVPYVTTPPILPGEDYTYRFPIRQNGTYWYHSHTHVQEQRGVYGAIVIHPAKTSAKVEPKSDAEAVLMLSDWTDENPDSVFKNLHKDGGYYLLKKGTMTSWVGSMRAKNPSAMKNYFMSEWTRMGPMDFSDVGYDSFLINGVPEGKILEKAHAGQTVRLRVINGASSSYFYFSIAGLPFQVISADGQNVKPVSTKELLIGMAETYDVLFKLPENKSYEIRASSQDGTGFGSMQIGHGELVKAPAKPIPNPYEMNHAGHAGHSSMNMSEHEHMHMHHMNHDEAPSDQLTYDSLRALSPTEFSKKAPRYEIQLVLDGNMDRYYWTINGKSIAEDRNIMVNEGDVIKFIFVNNSMMHHPMHLHGHFFRVLNAQNEYSPLKHTVDLPPFQTQTIEFLANEPGEWMLHCHNLYHMMSGMARIVKYSNFTPAPEIQHIQHHDPHHHDSIFWTARADVFSHVGELYGRMSDSTYQLDERVESRRVENWHPEVDLFARKWLDRYTNVFIGGEYFDEKARGLVGVSYMLPMLIQSSVMIGTNLKPRIDLGKRFQWTGHVYSDVEARFRWLGDFGDSWTNNIEWSTNLMYSLSWSWAFGLRIDHHSGGVGLTARF